MNRRRTGGFTLVEVIVAVAAMAVLGGFIMQLFVLSRQVSQSASDTDRALERASEIVSRFKLAQSPDAYWQELAGEPYASGDSISQYFDADWNPSQPERAALMLNAWIGDSGEDAPGCSDLRVRVVSVNAAGMYEELVHIRAARYFGALGEEAQP